MSKILVPQKVEKVVFEELSYNVALGRSLVRYTHEIDLIVGLKDMRNRIVIKSPYLFCGLEEDETYNVLIHYKMDDVNKDDDGKYYRSHNDSCVVKRREDMKLEKIEYDINGEDVQEITYVFSAQNKK